MSTQVSFDSQCLDDLCRRYHVVKLELFGSRAKGTAQVDSDVDFLVTFEGNRTPGLGYVLLAEELESIFHHRVDLILRDATIKSRGGVCRIGDEV